jgi:uncharacterized protein (DUF3084 family)
MTTDERIGRLTGIVETLAATVVAHDDQIEANARQIEATNRQIEATDRQIEALSRALEKQAQVTASLEKEWQAYLRNLKPN